MDARASTIVFWSQGHALVMLVAIVAVVLTRQPAILVIAALGSLTLLTLRERSALSGLCLGVGRANLVTGLRFCLLSSALILFVAMPNWLVVTMLVANVALDGIDGLLARRYQEQSDFGHYLDVEVDAYGIAVLSLLLWLHASVAAVVLLAAILRYVYIWLIKLTVTVEKLEPKRHYASVIAVVVYIVWTIRLVFHAPVFTLVLYFSLLLLVLSFARSAMIQWRN